MCFWNFWNIGFIYIFIIFTHILSRYPFFDEHAFEPRNNIPCWCQSYHKFGNKPIYWQPHLEFTRYYPILYSIVQLHAQSISWFHYDVIWCNLFSLFENESVTWIIKHMNLVSIHYVRIFDNIIKRTKPSVILYLIKCFMRVIFCSSKNKAFINRKMHQLFHHYTFITLHKTVA